MGSDTAASSARVARLEELRRAIADGTYAPAAGLVAESVLSWLVPATAWDGVVKPPPSSADPSSRTMDGEPWR